MTTDHKSPWKMTPEMIREVEKRLYYACEIGHGEVTLRVKDGKVRFLSFRYEEPILANKAADAV